MPARKKPQVVTVGSVKLPIYSTPTGNRERFTLAWYEAGTRKRKVFDRIEDAKAAANSIGIKIANGKVAALNLTAADHESYTLAMQALAPIGVPLHVAIEEYLSAKKVLPEGVTVKGAADEYARRHGVIRKVSVEACVTELLEAKKKAGVSHRHLCDLRSHLARLKSRFQVPIENVTARDIDRWLDDQDAGGRFKRNLRTSTITLFRFAQQRGYLPREIKTEADLSTLPDYLGGKPQIFTPEEMEKLAGCENENARLYFVLGGFAGIRSAELMRLCWEEIHFETGFIVIGSDKAKTATRRTIPIADNLAAWLAPFAGRRGRLFTAQKAALVAIRHGRPLLDREWPINGLRHSFASYRLALTQSREQVSREMGNSPQMLRTNYEEIKTHDGRIVTPSLARAWFAIAPKKPANVVTMKGAA